QLVDTPKSSANTSKLVLLGTLLPESQFLIVCPEQSNFPVFKRSGGVIFFFFSLISLRLGSSGIYLWSFKRQLNRSLNFSCSIISTSYKHSICPFLKSQE